MTEFALNAGNATTTDAAEKMKIIIPNTRHFIFLSPNSPKIPAKSMRTPTDAEAIAPTFISITAFTAEIGEYIPHTM